MDQTYLDDVTRALGRCTRHHLSAVVPDRRTSPLSHQLGDRGTEAPFAIRHPPSAIRQHATFAAHAALEQCPPHDEVIERDI
jgi:hypothetical protein